VLEKVKHNCILCNQEVEEYDRSQMSDKEYYLTFWKYELGTPEAEEAWKQKQAMMPQQPMQPGQPPQQNGMPPVEQEPTPEVAAIEDRQQQSKPATPAEPEISF